MKYTKLFNNHSEYEEYMASDNAALPNLSWCIQEDEGHFTPSLGCTPVHVYTLLGEPSYPSTVAASATSFELSFDYDDVYTSPACESSTTSGSSTVLVTITANPTTSTRTISGSYDFNGLSVPYSLTQEGQQDVPYVERYLTFNVITSGEILWKSFGSGQEKTISYSKDNGSTWVSITATSTGTPITVVAGDKVLFKGTNTSYATDKSNYSGFDVSGDTSAATYNIEGNIMSLIYGDNFTGNTAMTGTYNFCSIFKSSKVVSAENLILPSTTLTNYCYRAMFSWATSLEVAPALPAETLATGCYWYMFEHCAIETAPELNATTLVNECYGHMFEYCGSLNYIKCLATSDFSASNCLAGWTTNVNSTGTFIKDANAAIASGKWTRGANGIPNNWLVEDESSVATPDISFDGFSIITISCDTQGADIYYRLNETGNYVAYTTAITINDDTFIESYAVSDGQTSHTASQTCVYVSDVPIEYSNRDLKKWKYSGQEIETPYSVNGIDGHSANYAKGQFTFQTSFALSGAESTYLWFQHADQSAEIYIDNILVEKHWGGYAAFTTDVSSYVHQGVNNVKVILKNNEGNNLAPASGDFNFNATLGNVKLLTSPYVPAMSYGYDGFHVTSTVSSASATINVKTNIPTGATVTCTISGVNCSYTATSASTGAEMIFTTTISNPRLWNGKIDPYLYNVKLEISHNNEVYHRYERGYGLRYYEYVINDTVKVGTVQNPYTGFLLNGAKYLLRGCCMHDDIEGKANALNDADYTQTFSIIQELGLNFLRLAHYPHPKEVYDWCDRLGIVVQTEGPCVNKMQTTMPEEYYTRLNTQYSDMVNQHYNHPCILFWGLSNETTTDDKDFAKAKIEGYTTLIKSLDSERLVGYVLAQSPGTSPSAYYNDPAVDWFGCNMYVGWYDSPNSNNPSPQITTRLNNTINRAGVNKPMAYSEYGCGGTPTCHSDDFMNTTTRGNHERHDIEYMMWLHEGHIAAIKNFPQLLYTSQWQLFDIAVASRNEGYTECLDGVNTSINDDLRRLNNKGLVERDHVTKKDTFYLYKAWWNTASTFVHICQKNYTKTTSRVIKCYTNDGNSLTLYVNGTSAETVTVTDNIATFTARNFNDGDTVMVSGATSNDSFTFVSHDYVEIGGVKWATMNIGASSVTDYGMYFQWGDISGYTASQVGTDKVFDWTTYKYSDNGTSAMTKYNDTDGKTVLDSSDDAAQANWGGSWRMPTSAETKALVSATTSAWTNDYQGSGVSGVVLTDKTDSSKVLFFPAAGTYESSTHYGDGSYWTTSLANIGINFAYRMYLDNTNITYINYDCRDYGSTIRPVKDV